MRSYLCFGFVLFAMQLGSPASGEPPVGQHQVVQPPSPRPAPKVPRKTEFPFKPWSYAKAYTYNFFEDQPVPMRVMSEEGTWSPHIRSEQFIADVEGKRAADLVAKTRGSIELTKCTFPRHAIVFFDANDKPVASIDVCFSCEAVLAWPDYERPENFDYERSAKTLEKLLPVWRAMFEKDFGVPIDWKTAPQRSP